MSYLEITDEAKRLPLHEQLLLLEEVARSIQRQVAPHPNSPEPAALMAALRGALKPPGKTTPFEGAFPLTDDWLDSAKNEGRA